MITPSVGDMDQSLSLKVKSERKVTSKEKWVVRKKKKRKMGPP
jgi:hypothetical protein